LRRLSESIRKLPLVTTTSPACTPLLTSSKPSAFAPNSTSRGSKTLSGLATKTRFFDPVIKTASSGTAIFSPKGA